MAMSMVREVPMPLIEANGTKTAYLMGVLPPELDPLRIL
jgi:hypothetical protein